MPRPSGICEGIPCYTQADRDAIAAELANAEAELANAEAELTDAQNVRDAKAQAVMELQMEQTEAETKQCP